MFTAPSQVIVRMTASGMAGILGLPGDGDPWYGVVDIRSTQPCVEVISFGYTCILLHMHIYSGECVRSMCVYEYRAG